MMAESGRGETGSQPAQKRKGDATAQSAIHGGYRNGRRHETHGMMAESGKEDRKKGTKYIFFEEKRVQACICQKKVVILQADFILA